MKEPRVAFDKELVLAQLPLLKDLERSQIKLLAPTTKLVNHPRGKTIFQKGDPGDSMMAVVRGKVKICAVSPDGKEVVYRIIEQGGVFGEIGLLDGEPRSADAVALETSDLLVLERRHFSAFLEAHPKVTLQLIGLLCKRLRATTDHLHDRMTLEVPARLARTLLRLVETFGKHGAGDQTKLDLKLSQSQLGAIIGVSRESVNKYLGEWSKEGYIKIESGIITILDSDALETIATTYSEDDDD